MSQINAQPGSGGGGGGAFTSITGTATQVAYFDLSGNGTSDSLFTRNATTKETSIGATLTGSIDTSYSLSNNFLGFGLTGAGQVFNTGSGGYNLLASIDTTAFGGQKDTTVVGYTAFGAGPVANGSYSYKASTDTASIQLRADSSTGKSSAINITSTAATNKIKFDFDTGNYKFPTTSPSSGQVLGYSSANQLGFITAPISIGGAITGSTANRVLFSDASNLLAQSSKFTFNKVTNEFSVGTGSVLTVDPTNGIVATQVSSADTFTATTPLGKALKVYTGGGMGNLIAIGDVDSLGNKTSFSVADGSRIIQAISDGTFQVANSTSQRILFADVASKTITIGDYDNAYYGLSLVVDNFAGGINLGNQGGAGGNSTRITINDASKTITGKLDGVFSIEDISTSSIAYIDAANRQSVFGNVSSAGGIKMYIDETVGINVQAPGAILNLGANTFGNETNLQVDDTTGIIKALIPTGGDFEVVNAAGNVAFTVIPDNFYTKIGDADNAANGTSLIVDDATQSIAVSKPFTLKGYTVATLPAGVVGNTAYVTDALTPVFGATVVGGGAVTIPVFYNGTNWIVG